MGANLEEWLHLIGRGEGIDTAPAVLVLARRRITHDPLVDEFVAERRDCRVRR
jgi:hypothetical protein